MSLSNYPDGFDPSVLEDPPEEENTCEHEEFDFDEVSAGTSVNANIRKLGDDIMVISYYCNNCGARGEATHKIGSIEWTEDN